MVKKRLLCIFSLFSVLLTVSSFLPIAFAAGNNPTDPYLLDQWGWYNIYADVPYYYGFRGNSSIIVAVIDTGIDLDHPDLIDNIYTNPNDPLGGGDDDGNGYIDDINGWNFVDNNNDASDHDGHGSHCSGIIAGNDNTIGVCGVAPDVKILPIKVIETKSGSLGTLAEAIEYAIMMNASVISMSIGSTGGAAPPAVEAAINNAYNNGCVLVAAAGNEYPTDPVLYPASNSQVIAVAAVTSANAWSSYSCVGPEVEIAAPGGDSPYGGFIISTYNVSNYVYSIGTSMAAPHVSGVVALMLHQNMSLSPDEIRLTINQTAIPLGLPATQVGEGLINAAGCLGFPLVHMYDPMLDWLNRNLWWIVLIGLTVVILILIKVARKPKKVEPTYTTTSTEYDVPEYY